MTSDSEEDCPHCQEEAQELAMHAKHDEIAKRLGLTTRLHDMHRPDVQHLQLDHRTLLAEVARLEARLHHDCPGCPGCPNDCPDALDVALREVARLEGELAKSKKTEAHIDELLKMAEQQRDRAVAAIKPILANCHAHILECQGYVTVQITEKQVQAMRDAEAPGGGV